MHRSISVKNKHGCLLFTDGIFIYLSFINWIETEKESALVRTNVYIKSLEFRQKAFFLLELRCV